MTTMIVQLARLARRRTRAALLPLVIMACLSATYAAGSKPPIEQNPPPQPDTVGSWCRLTTYAPYKEGGYVKGKSNFSCSGHTRIDWYYTYLRADNIIVKQDAYFGFTANGGTTYYDIASVACSAYPGTHNWDVRTRIDYIDPNTNTVQILETTGPIITITC